MSRKRIDITGKKFGRLTVIKLSHTKKLAYWLCKCECGNKCIVEGSNLKRKHTESCGCLHLELAKKAKGNKSPHWIGKDIGYHGLHDRVRKVLPKPKVCLNCKINKPRELSNISGKYKTSLSDWEYLCVNCHRRKDHGWIFKNNKWFKKCKPCGKLLEVNKDNFNKSGNRPWFSYCKDCQKIYSHNHHLYELSH